ncbi:MAG: polysaccharide export protein [Gammaproteobacteria bacterium]|nr:polysaccharide export protein [Gammaproteobacteria bacterium]MDH5799210.1 polysaccharide export protein [Gammaproteobacteria bacterium]
MKFITRCFLLVLVGLLTGCATVLVQPKTDLSAPNFEYRLGPGDIIDIFVWRNSDLTVNGIPVRPDGKISVPLVEELSASGKTPKQLARDIEGQLAKYIKDPFVTVMVRDFVGQIDDQIRVVGEAATPRSLAYRKSLTVLDVMIAVGGLTEHAAGNRAVLVRKVGGKQVSIPVYLESLLKDGVIDANISMAPGDILIIPESWF